MPLLQDVSPSAFDLSAACHALGVPLVGVFKLEELKELPERYLKPGAFLLQHPTREWAALHIPERGYPTYFDNFTPGYTPAEVMDFLGRMGKTSCSHVEKTFPRNEMGYYGQYCILFLAAMTMDGSCICGTYKYRSNDSFCCKVTAVSSTLG